MVEGSIPITQLVLSLVGAVGVGNFILIAVVLFLIVNAPMLIERILQYRHIVKMEQKNTDYLNVITSKVKDIHNVVGTLHTDTLTNTSFLKNSIQEIDSLKDAVVVDTKTAEEERYLITDTLAKILSSLDGIDKMMRNVISEKDTGSLFAIKVGILDNFKNILLNKITNAIEVFPSSELAVNLENEINSAWSDLKVELDVFNTPIKMGRYLSKYDQLLWGDEEMFRRVINLATSNFNPKRKMETISRQIDIGLRKIHSDLNNFLLDNSRMEGN